MAAIVNIAEYRTFLSSKRVLLDSSTQKVRIQEILRISLVLNRKHIGSEMNSFQLSSPTYKRTQMDTKQIENS